MTDSELQRYYDVSLPPSLHGGGAAPEAMQQSAKVLPDDPDGFTIAQIEEWVAAHPDDVDAVLAAEVEGKNRTTLVAWLEEQTAEPEAP